MPMPEKMGVMFTGTQKQDIVDHLTGIRTILASIKVVQLTKAERQGASSVDNVRLPYVIKGEQLAQINVPLRPGFMSLADCTNDVKMTQDMMELKNQLNETTDVFIDFSLASEHFAYKFMLKFYESAQGALGTPTPGVDTVIDALAPLFEKQGSNLPPVTPP